jgi:S-adenosylmethionine hydrolase
LAKKIITLTTDFGLRDLYVAEMKAAILGICPDAAIVDVTHEIEKFNVRAGAYMLACAAPYFPKGTIHVVVVDPGVGTRRRSLLIETQQAFFVGPSNGVLVLAAEKQGIISAHEITNPRLRLPKVSSTFHGRDVFAPAAAHLANGVSPTAFGPEIWSLVSPDFARVTFSKGTLTGEILHIDGFGNIVTNVTEENLKRLHAKNSVNIEMANCSMSLKLAKTYAEAKPEQAVILVGSQGYVEIAVNQGNAARKFKAEPGDRITLSARS